jgi:zinc protease
MKAYHSLPGPDDITRVVLPNGITVLTRSNFNSPSVFLTGYLACGGMYDPDDRLGLANFTALALMRGTRQRNFQQIFECLESAGASLGFGASVHTASFSGRCLAEDLPMLVDLLSQALRYPVFPPEQIERLRGQLLTGLAIRAQDTSELASLTFDETLFAGHPYGRSEDGYLETVQAISHQDLVEFHQRQYGPAEMAVVVVGAITPQEAVEQVQAVLEDWSNPEQKISQTFPVVRIPQKTIRIHKPLPGKYQTDLVMGVVGPRRRSDDFLPASLGNNILGQFGMMGRIGDVVREQAGLAYSASTSLNAWPYSGSWEVSAGVNPANLSRAIDLILSELGRFIADGVTAEELADSQANYIGRLPLSLESNAGVASALLNLQRFELGLDYYRRYPDLVRSVTRQQVLEAARRYLDPERMVIVSSGPEIVE